MEPVSPSWTVMEFDVGRPFLELRQRFTDVWESPLAKPLTPEWIDAYQARRVLQVVGVLEADDYAQPVHPRAVQVLALQELDRIRADGEHRALSIAATGLGKTYLAAFDSMTFPRVLFVAHREELLRQVVPTAQVEATRCPAAASIQTIFGVREVVVSSKHFS